MNTTRISKLPFALAALTLLAAGAAHAGQSLDGHVRVTNERMAPVKVSIDGERLTRLAPGESRVFRGVPNGVRLVRVHGRQGRHQATERLSVPIERMVDFRIEARRGLATIVNDSGLRMRITLDGRDLGVARPGQSVESRPMKPGSYTLEARPANSRYSDGEALVRRIDVRRGQRNTHRVGQWYGSVQVYNPFPFGAALFVDGERIERMRPGTSLPVARLAPGRHRLVFKRHGRVLASETMRIAPGKRAAWRPVDANRGDLRVSNNTGRRVKVQIDGRDMGHLDRGESRTFADLDAGVHVVTLMRRGRVVEQQRIRVRAHDMTNMVASRPATYRPRRPDHPEPLARR